jgi:hypothetical protein
MPGWAVLFCGGFSKKMALGAQEALKCVVFSPSTCQNFSHLFHWCTGQVLTP